MNKELNGYLKLFNNYQRRFKHMTILIPVEIYNAYKYIIEEKAALTGFNKCSEISNVIIFKNWS